MKTNSSNKRVGNHMKIVVIGGSGLIGKKVVNNLREEGHEVVAASPSSGVNTLTGEGLAEALAGAQVVVDVANSPTFEEKASLEFFERSGRNLFAAEAVAGVRHHVALSVVGTERLLAMGYFGAKLAQEKLIKGSGIPYSIVRATQFFEFLGAIAQSATEGQMVRLPSAAFQPIAAEDVAAALTDVALGEPLNDTIEVAGPERTGLDELVRRFLRGTKDPREVITDAKARYFGVAVNDQTLVPGVNARIAPTWLEDWLGRSNAQKQTNETASAPKSSRPSPRKIALGLLLFLCGIAFATPCVSAGSAHDTSNEKSKVTLVYEHVLPNVPGKSIKGVLVEYQPGGSSPAHTHPHSAFIYATVLEGAIRSQVNNGPVMVYRAGESFSEMPGDHHGVSANASETEPARLLAVFVVDTDEKNLTTNDTK
jgi:uncharacterized protein YbjT (DUF2867 family)/quercetin dioxygenase-like cupin family protein